MTTLLSVGVESVVSLTPTAGTDAVHGTGGGAGGSASFAGTLSGVLGASADAPGNALGSAPGDAPGDAPGADGQGSEPAAPAEPPQPGGTRSGPTDEDARTTTTAVEPAGPVTEPHAAPRASHLPRHSHAGRGRGHGTRAVDADPAVPAAPSLPGLPAPPASAAASPVVPDEVTATAAASAPAAVGTEATAAGIAESLGAEMAGDVRADHPVDGAVPVPDVRAAPSSATAPASPTSTAPAAVALPTPAGPELPPEPQIIASSQPVEAMSSTLSSAPSPRAHATAAEPVPDRPADNTSSAPSLTPVAAVAPLPATSAPAPAPPAAPAQQAAELTPSTQPGLGVALGRLRARADGTHQLTVALHPAELGSVAVTATVRDGTLTVTVTCADRAAHDAVAAALPLLHRDLAGHGFTALTLDAVAADVGAHGGAHGEAHSGAAQHGDDHGGRWHSGAASERTRRDGADAPDSWAAPAARRTSRDTALDRLL
jgi:hypothetical protein